MSDDGILGEIQGEMAAMKDDLPDRDGVYDPVDDMDPRGSVAMDWPTVDPENHDLTPEEWGMRGEGTPDDWERFATALNYGIFAGHEYEIRPEPPESWGRSTLPMVRSKRQERGKHLYVKVGVSAASHLRNEAVVGSSLWDDMEPRDFISELDPKVHEYREMFEDGQRPGDAFLFFDNDLTPTGPQEGRHRAAAALMAGIEWVPTWVLMDTAGTFYRSESRRKPDGPGYRANYEPL